MLIGYRWVTKEGLGPYAKAYPNQTPIDIYEGMTFVGKDDDDRMYFVPEESVESFPDFITSQVLYCWRVAALSDPHVRYEGTVWHEGSSRILVYLERAPEYDREDTDAEAALTRAAEAAGMFD